MNFAHLGNELFKQTSFVTPLIVAWIKHLVFVYSKESLTEAYYRSLICTPEMSDLQRTCPFGDAFVKEF